MTHVESTKESLGGNGIFFGFATPTLLLLWFGPQFDTRVPIMALSFPPFGVTPIVRRVVMVWLVLAISTFDRTTTTRVCAAEAAFVPRTRILHPTPCYYTVPSIQVALPETRTIPSSRSLRSSVWLDAVVPNQPGDALPKNDDDAVVDPLTNPTQDDDEKDDVVLLHNAVPLFTGTILLVLNLLVTGYMVYVGATGVDPLTGELMPRAAAGL